MILTLTGLKTNASKLLRREPRYANMAEADKIKVDQLKNKLADKYHPKACKEKDPEAWFIANVYGSVTEDTDLAQTLASWALCKTLAVEVKRLMDAIEAVQKDITIS